VGAMIYPKFIAYNVIGGLAWVALFTFGGYFFGNLPIVQENFTFVILAIIFISVLPAIIELIKGRQQTRKSTQPPANI
jgi:membrane-associated protein